jgi:SAM-dependent methyltransferase
MLGGEMISTNRVYLETNRRLWDGWAKLHAKSDFYELERFKTGKTTLKSVELEELGDVAGRSRLHLQCHFGMDTLSWARRGAQVTGVDFSQPAISLARSLSNDLNISAEFTCSDIFELPEVLDRQFDIVFTSYGVLEWLPDLERWAQLVAHYLKPGGTFYMVEFHPFVGMLDDDVGQRIEYDYFFGSDPIRSEEQGSYADPEADFSHTSYVWAHSLGETVTALISAGLRLEFLHEFPYSVYNCWRFFEESAPGKYEIIDSKHAMPLMFSIRATR